MAADEGPLEHVDTFDAPVGCTRVRFLTDELLSVCPLTGQPDVSSLEIDYLPAGRCVESRSLKRYLWSFRQRGVFAEALAVEIADEIERATAATGLRVVVTQHVRGGIVTECTAERGLPLPRA